jgi:hypothetical protein
LVDAFHSEVGDLGDHPFKELADGEPALADEGIVVGFAEVADGVATFGAEAEMFEENAEGSRLGGLAGDGFVF